MSIDAARRSACATMQLGFCGARFSVPSRHSCRDPFLTPSHRLFNLALRGCVKTRDRQSQFLRDFIDLPED